MRGIKPPELGGMEGSTWWWLALGIALGVAITLAILCWLKGKKTPTVETSAPTEDPVQEELKAIRQLDDLRTLAIRLSTFLRMFLGERIKEDLTQLTNEQACQRLGTTTVLNAAAKQQAQDFLNQCDVLAFSSRKRYPSDGRELTDEVSKFVEQLRNESPTHGAVISLSASEVAS